MNVVYPIIYKGLGYIPNGGWPWDFWTINSILRWWLECSITSETESIEVPLIRRWVIGSLTKSRHVRLSVFHRIYGTNGIYLNLRGRFLMCKWSHSHDYHHESHLAKWSYFTNLDFPDKKGPISLTKPTIWVFLVVWGRDETFDQISPLSSRSKCHPGWWLLLLLRGEHPKIYPIRYTNIESLDQIFHTVTLEVW